MAIPATIVYFVGYESIRNRMQSYRILPKEEVLAPLLAGASARVIAATLISPLELIRTNMMSQEGSAGSVRQVMAQVTGACRQHGMSVLFKGLVPTLWRDVPFSAIYWASFEAIKRRLAQYLGSDDRPSNQFTVSFVSGAASGVLAATATTPFDVAKTRTQIQISKTGNIQPQRMLHVLHTIWREEGLAGVTRGLVPRICKVAPACAIMIGSYEAGKSFFRQAHVT